MDDIQSTKIKIRQLQGDLAEARFDILELQIAKDYLKAELGRQQDKLQQLLGQLQISTLETKSSKLVEENSPQSSSTSESSEEEKNASTNTNPISNA